MLDENEVAKLIRSLLELQEVMKVALADIGEIVFNEGEMSMGYSEREGYQLLIDEYEYLGSIEEQFDQEHDIWEDYIYKRGNITWKNTIPDDYYSLYTDNPLTATAIVILDTVGNEVIELEEKYKVSVLIGPKSLHVAFNGIDMEYIEKTLIRKIRPLVKGSHFTAAHGGFWIT